MALFKKKIGEKKPAVVKTPRKEGEVKLSWQSIKSPHITEKASFLEGKNQYVFKVFDHTNKSQIKKAVEEIYKVKVVRVNIINTKSKIRKKGKIVGRKPGYKKAMVSLKEGQKIEILPR